MFESNAEGVLNEDLDDLGREMFKLYTQICFCYPLESRSNDSAIIETLTNGLERLSAGFPWLAGQVLREGPDESVFKIKPLEKTPRLIFKDLRNDHSIPTMDALREAEFPFRMLDESIIAPRNTLPESHTGPASDPAPVLLLQATFITGGLLLTFAAQHNTMDMMGQSQVMRLFSKACRNEAFTSEELSSGNLACRHLISLLDDSDEQYLKEPASQTAQSVPFAPIPNDTNPHPAPPPKCTWVYFNFNHNALTALKSLASQTLTPPSEFISTDDALTAFLWQSILRARLPRLTSTAASKSTLTRAVDVRRYLNIPATYTGLMQKLVWHTYTLQQLVEISIGAIASQLRLAISPKTSTLAYETRKLATLFARAPDKSVVSFMPLLDLSTDVMLSSWAKVECWDVYFGL